MRYSFITEGVEALSMGSLTIIESVLGLILATVLGVIVGFERK